ncbi:alginate export family protein [Gimibacter soli]|uniref:Alginate export family protein n=1 Tax=Gimibacter soli TaxID=3024400 RepID=A0AAE9XWA4_9PROT|nr:alginate export family protein [Gimibacter soli]WCL55563.1 alginate export family protein [Gimibacter soli]
MQLANFPLSFIALALAAAGTAHADDAQSLTEALTKGDPNLGFRYRLELVDQDGLAEDATASTLRTRLGYRTGTFKGFSAYLEFEDVTVVGETTYNDTINGKTRYPVVADPDGTELNQAYLTYTNGSGLTLQAGRQGINLGTQRFVGTVGWRQNDQTFDAVTGIFQNGNLTAVAAHVWNVNRVFSDRHPLGSLETATEVLQLSYKASPALELTAFGLLIDLDTDTPAVNAALSSQTYGLRAAGAAEFAAGTQFTYSADYARQYDYGDAIVDYSTDYYAIEGALTVSGITATAGYEVLAAADGMAFQTPLATLHKFNGWADRFLTTPVGGLTDFYAGAATKIDTGALAGLALQVTWHTFAAEDGGADYGDEIDWQISKKLGKSLSLALKGVHYRTGGFATDTDKVWLTLGAEF